MNANASSDGSIESDVDREQRERAHAKLRLLRVQLRAANVARENAITEMRMWCRAARRLAHERDRLRAFVALVAETDGARRTAREALVTRKEQIERASDDLYERARAELASEWTYKEQLQRLERDHRQQRRHVVGGVGASRRNESDDDVRASVPAKLLPFFEQVKEELCGSAGESRTEAFLRFSEAHPERVLASIDGSFDARIADLEARSAEITTALRRRDRTAEQWDSANWIRSALREGCSHLRLVQRVADDPGTEILIHEWPLTNDADVDGIVEALSRRGSLREPGLYGLFVYKPGQRIHFDRKILRVDGAPPRRAAPLRSRGRQSSLARALRYAEANAKVTVEQSIALIETYREIIQERDARIAVLERRHLHAVPSPSDGEKKP
jgi:hypothetical protein